MLANVTRWGIIELNNANSPPQNTEPDAPKNTEAPASDFQRLTIGSAQPPVTFAALEHEHAGDAAFANFRIRLNTFLSRHLQQHVQFKAIDKVCFLTLCRPEAEINHN